jgi:phosphoribosylformimino-5-aminoimidazole carboxamide ribotide isomerase
MIAIPSVEIADASSGRAGSITRPERQPGDASVIAARALADLGFARLHLDGPTMTTSASATAPAVEHIAHSTDATIQVAGPSSVSEIEQLFRAGAEYVVVGARAIDEPEWLASIVDLYPDAIVVATDVRDRRVVRQGWVRTLPVDILDLADELSSLSLAGILVGGLHLDGPGRHADLALVEDLTDRSRVPISIRARIETVNDLRALEHRGAAAAVLRADQLNGTLDPRVIAREFGG